MHILKTEVSAKNAAGSIKLKPTEEEDIYHLYNIIAVGDTVTGSTSRNIVSESSTGSTRKSKVRMTMAIVVDAVDFDMEQCSLRLKGRNTTESEHLRLGQFHTMEMVIDYVYTVVKDHWDALCMGRLDQAQDVERKADLAAIVMQEGLCHVTTVTPAMTITKARIERRMPKKKQGFDTFAKAQKSFFSDIYMAVRLLKFPQLKVVIIGSPGFLKGDFFTYMMERAQRNDDRIIIENKSKFLQTHASSGHKKAIAEILADDSFGKLLADVKAADETRALQHFHAAMMKDEDRACYGHAFCVAADDQSAIETLLVTDKFLKVADPKVRQRHIELMDSVRSHGGAVYQFSSMHVSGQQLDLYTGIAATLRFPLCLEVLEDGVSAAAPPAASAASTPAAAAAAVDDDDVDMDYWSATDSDDDGTSY